MCSYYWDITLVYATTVIRNLAMQKISCVKEIIFDD